MTPDNKRRVVVTGLGIVSSLGHNVDTFWNACLSGTSRVERIPENWENFASYTSRYWAPLDEPDYNAALINRLEHKQLDPVSRIALAAASEALEHAGIDITQADAKRNTYVLPGFDPVRCGVFMGTGVGGINTLSEIFAHQLFEQRAGKLTDLAARLRTEHALESAADELDTMVESFAQARRFNPYSVSMLMPSAPAANISIKYKLQGISETTCRACASGTAAIGRGYEAIKGGHLDTALAGGAEYLYDACGTVFRSFDAVNTLVHGDLPGDQINRPFDKARSGFLFSQGGAAVLILESLETAMNRNAPILSEITGFAETCDAHNIMMTEPEGKAIESMLRMLLGKSGLQPADVDYINTHGTGTMLNDEVESAVIEKLFGDGVQLNASKSLVGHTIGAPGAIEALITVLTLHTGITHGCRNLENPLRALNFIRESGPVNAKTAISHSFAFGGHNAGLLFRSFA